MREFQSQRLNDLNIALQPRLGRRIERDTIPNSEDMF